MHSSINQSNHSYVSNVTPCFIKTKPPNSYPLTHQTLLFKNAELGDDSYALHTQ